MALLGNYTLHQKSPGRSFGGSTVGANGGSTHSRAAFTGSSALRARYTSWQGSGFSRISGLPNGNRPPYSIIIAPEDGSISSYTQSSGAITPVANLAGGRNLTLTGATMSITVTNAQLDQIVSFIASSAMAIAKDDANLAAAAAAIASAAMAIAKDDALCGAIFSVTGSGICAISPDSDITAIGHMEAEAGGATPLSPEGLSIQLLDNEDIETGYSMRESLRLILSALVGKLSGAATTTVSIRDINDTVDRIVATVDTNGNRSAVTKDVS